MGDNWDFGHKIPRSMVQRPRKRTGSLSRTLADEARGDAHTRCHQGLSILVANGHMSDPIARAMVNEARAEARANGTLTLFLDLGGVTSYAVEARETLDDGLTALGRKLIATHVASETPLGDALAASLTERRAATVHASSAALREAFGIAVASAALSRSASGSVPPPDDGALVIDGRYRIGPLLGEGAMGQVFLAEDEILERPTALKIGRLRTRRARDRAEREAVALASVQHPHVALVYTAGAERGAPFLAMEYVEGASLSEVMELHGGALPLVSAAMILAKVARGLGALHQAGVVHRDIKPSNVIVERTTGRPVIVDLGLAFDARDLPDDIIAGTPAYLAPELGHGGGRPSPQSDLYAWGAMAVELLTGAPPFDGDDPMAVIHAHAVEPPEPPSQRRAALAPLDALLLATLAKRPSERPESAHDLARELERFVDGAWSGRAAGRRRLLVASADLPVADRLARALSRHFGEAAEVLRCGSAAEVERAVAAGRVDGACVDSLLPDAHGLDVVARLQLGAADATKVVVLKPPSLADEWRFRAVGVTEFLEPDRPQELPQRFEGR